MKYYKLDYNANQPSNKQISVPTDSVYGVAVKIEKDGSVLTGETNIGDLSATTTRGGYDLFDLSAGSTPSMTKKEISITTSSTIDGTETLEQKSLATQNRACNLQMMFYLSSITDWDIDAGATLSVDGVKGCTVMSEISAASGEGWSELSTKAVNVEAICNGKIWKIDGDTWKMTSPLTYADSLPLDNKNFRLRTGLGQLNFGKDTTQNRLVSLTATVEVDTGDGFSGSFPLFVSEIDAGYVEQ